MLGAVILSCVVAGFLWFLATPLRTGLWRVPGPFWRRYSDIFQALDAYNGVTCRGIQALHKQYGPVVAVGPRTVMFADPKMIDVIYATRQPYPKSYHWQPLRTELKGVHYPSLIASEDTATHSSLKRPIAGVYAMSNVTKSESFINEMIRQLVARLDTDYAQKDSPFPVFSWMHFFAYDTIMKLTVSQDFGLVRGEADQGAMFKGVDAAQTYRAMAAAMPWIHNLLKNTPIVGVFQKRMGSFPARARELIQKRKAAGAGAGAGGGGNEMEEISSDREDLLSQILETKEKHPQIVNDLVMHGYATTPLLAGADTVTIGLTSIVYFVGKNPQVLRRVQAELDSSGLTFPPSWADVQKLTYLDAVIRESFRCHPIGAMLSRRAVPYNGAGLTLGENGGGGGPAVTVTLPPGTAVAVSGWATHFNAEIYGEDMLDFNPDRWLQGSEEGDDEFAERTRRMNRADLTWGHGDRACMGKNIARCEMYKLMATLYKNFDIQLVDPKAEWEIKETVLAKQIGVEATIKRRANAKLDELN